MKKRITVLCLICILLFSGCSCKHEWKKADCVTPKTCGLCQETEGEPLGHNWQDANCIEPKTCMECGRTEGVAKGHDWKDATCTSPLMCAVCARTEGSALGHSWSEATCTLPVTCYACGLTSGEPLGHSVETWEITQDATCTEEGTECGICTLCKENIERSVAVKEHTPGDWEITEEPTEHDPGKRQVLCKQCGVTLESESFTLSAEELEKRYKEKCKSISYDNLSRYPDDYEGEYVTFRGKVVQVCSEAKSAMYYSTYRVATSGSYNNVVYIYVDNYGSGSRILEDDWITFYGKYDGLYTYTTVMGASVTIPSVKVEYID